jgi:hypothetical protein
MTREPVWRSEVEHSGRFDRIGQDREVTQFPKVGPHAAASREELH